MKIDGWRYYNHAAMPDVAPHEKVNMFPLQDGSIWKVGGGKALLARWISDFDCEYETKWWYIIKDTPFEIMDLKAKRRYEINKGLKNFQVREINPVEFKEDIYTIQVEAYKAYPIKYRPNVNKKILFSAIDEWKYYKFYGAFSKETNKLCGYAWLNKKDRYIYYAFHKVIPLFEKQGINAAIVASILENHRNELNSGDYICDGSRSISHETNFQAYLEKYFGFRKAYCKLHIKYRGVMKVVVGILYPLRKQLLKYDDISIIHQINGIMKMEEIVRASRT